MLSLKEIYNDYKAEHLKEVGADLYLRLVNILSLPFIKAFLIIRIPPNQITILWSIIGLFSSFLFIPGSYALNIIGAVMVNFTLVIDACDGTIARIRNTASNNGGLMESMGHWIVDAGLMASIAFGSFNRFDNPLFFALGFTALSALFLKNLIVKEKMRLFVYQKEVPLKRNGQKNLKILNDSILRKVYEKTEKLHLFDFFCIILPILAIFDIVHFFLLVYGLSYPLLFLATYWYHLRSGFEEIEDAVLAKADKIRKAQGLN